MATEELGATEGQVGLAWRSAFSEKNLIMRIALFALLALPCVVPVNAETLTGTARIIDADTVEIAVEKVRLEGIDAPESRQTCKRDGKRYDCGKEATSALRVKIGKASITCKGDTRDQYDRLIAVCYLDDLDLNRWLVRQGHALAYRRFSNGTLPPKMRPGKPSVVSGKDNLSSRGNGAKASGWTDPTELRELRHCGFQKEI